VDVKSGFHRRKEGCLPQRGVDDDGFAVSNPTLDIVEPASTAESEEGFRFLDI
jgi:hypothetical protein